MNRIETPWPFSTPGGPRDGIPNLPSPEGAAIGKELARLTENSRLDLSQRFPNMRPMCTECAFRDGTIANQCAATVMDAIKCVSEGHIFYCHKGIPDNGEPKRPCAGYMIAISTTTESRQPALNAAPGAGGM